jgi:pimeloyl-ACP methyl ester carboxylesterase
VRGLLVAVAAGVLAVALFRWLVDRLVFQPTPGADLSLEQLGVAGEELYLRTEDGVRIHAFFVPSEGASRALLFLHGNAGNASHRLPNAVQLAELGVHVLLLEYRGYGKSEGTASEEGVFADARAGLAHLTTELGIPEERIFLFGRSLGGAVALDLARGRRLAGVILESTFTSLAEMAGRIGVGPLAPLLRGRFDSLTRIRELRAPLLFFHGDRDEVVPFDLGRRLFEAAPEPKAFETIRGAGHNDTVLVGGRAYFERIRRFLADPPGPPPGP